MIKLIKIALAAMAAAVIFVALVPPAHAQLNCYEWERNLPQCQQPMQIAPAPYHVAPGYSGPQQMEPADNYVIPEKYRRREVPVNEQAAVRLGINVGDIYIDREARYLYLQLTATTAMRYKIAVGRQGFGDKTRGEYYIGRKEIDPDWIPPPEMLQRQPNLPRRVAGGAPDNPLGHYAMRLYNIADKPGAKKVDDKANEYSLFNIHATNEPWTIGGAKSSGCFRMYGKDAEDLYNRIKAGLHGAGTRVVVS